MTVNPTRWQILDEGPPNVFLPATDILPFDGLDAFAVFNDPQVGPADLSDPEMAVFGTYDFGPLQALLDQLQSQFGRAFSCAYVWPT